MDFRFWGGGAVASPIIIFFLLLVGYFLMSCVLDTL